ncbi:MAG: proteasome subunit beta, partial [Actinobacteria bacterium]|nr:proteasome subunit beta [Actinomycetota bacterium]
TLKERWGPNMDQAGAVRAAVEALHDASQEDVATGGIDPIRGIYPTIKTITSGGVNDVAQDEIRTAFDAIIAERQERGARD